MVLLCKRAVRAIGRVISGSDGTKVAAGRARSHRLETQPAAASVAEGLERRLMLAVTAAEYGTIRSTYPTFDLPADMSGINIIEITPERLSVGDLKSAIVAAGNTSLPDLVVLRTTDGKNTITYASDQDELKIDIPSNMGSTSIVGFGSQALTLDAANKCRVLTVGSSGSTAIVNLGGLILTHGRTQDHSGGVYGESTYDASVDGGGIYHASGELRLTNVTLSENLAGYGGGMFQDEGAIVLANVNIRANQARNDGGGAYLSGGTSSFTKVTIAGNVAFGTTYKIPGGHGGGMYQSGGTATMVDVVIRGNKAGDSGGGVYLDDGTLIFKGGSINKNLCELGGGGGIYQAAGTSTLTTVKVTENTSLSHGGAISLTGGTSTVTNTILSANSASGSGGGIYQSNGGSTITNTTISDNDAGSGGGVYLDGHTMTLQNTIVADNSSSDAANDISQASGTLSGRQNLLGNGEGQSAFINNRSNIVGTPARPIDPMLARGLAPGIGLAPLPGSPVIDAGDTGLVPSGIVVDIYGNARVQGSRINIGAVESVVPRKPGVTYVVTSLADNTLRDGVVTLREALAAANSNTAVGDAPAGSYSDADRIVFAPGLRGTIRTNGEQYEILDNLELVGPGIDNLILDGGRSSQVLVISGPCRVTLQGFTVSGGYTSFAGAGIRSTDASVIMKDMLVTGNRVGYGVGGGVVISGGSISLTSVTVTKNAASGGGGGLYLSDCTAVLTNLIMTGNIASNGGGIFQAGGTSNLTNVVMTGNSATDCGGGMYLSGVTSTLTNVTIAANYANDEGGGLYQAGGRCTLRNSIVAQNESMSLAPDVSLDYGNPGILDVANSLIGNGTGHNGIWEASLQNGKNGNLVGNAAHPVDPRFVQVIEWTSQVPPDKALQLRGESPAIDRGNSAYLPVSVVTDILGRPRITGRGVDIGAYERQAGDLTLSASGVAEHQPAGTLVGTWDTSTCKLVGGTDYPDNASFAIVGDQLRTAVRLNYEAKRTYTIRVRERDQIGLSYTKTLTIGVKNINETPTSLSVSSKRIAEKMRAGTVVGRLSTVDPDIASSFTYTLAGGDSYPDNAAFRITANGRVKANQAFDFETRSRYSILVRSTDQGGLFCERPITIRVTDVSEAPAGLALTNYSVLEHKPAGELVGKLVGTDLDAGNTLTYTLIGGAGSRDNAMFSILGVRLWTAGRFDYATQSVYKIRVRVTDQGGLWFEKAMVVGVTHG